MENLIWGDSTREYENLNTLNLLETIQDLKIKNNELQSALEIEKKTEVPKRRKSKLRSIRSTRLRRKTTMTNHKQPLDFGFTYAQPNHTLVIINGEQLKLTHYDRGNGRAVTLPWWIWKKIHKVVEGTFNPVLRHRGLPVGRFGQGCNKLHEDFGYELSLLFRSMKGVTTDEQVFENLGVWIGWGVRGREWRSNIRDKEEK